MAAMDKTSDYLKHALNRKYRSTLETVRSAVRDLNMLADQLETQRSVPSCPIQHSITQINGYCGEINALREALEAAESFGQ